MRSFTSSAPGNVTAIRPRIFESFLSGRADGTGLGLANARRLAEEMEGEVELEAGRSPLGGACFRFLLPVWEKAPRVDGIRGDEAAQSRMS